jgi:hypothetical protein
MSRPLKHANRRKLAMNAHCPYTEYRQGLHPGRGMAGILDRKGAPRTNDGTGAQVNRGIS